MMQTIMGFNAGHDFTRGDGALLGICVVAGLAFASAAHAADAKPITIVASPQEVQQLAQLLDIATKSCGLQCAQSAVIWAQKLQQAVNDANAPPISPGTK